MKKTGFANRLILIFALLLTAPTTGCKNENTGNSSSKGKATKVAPAKTANQSGTDIQDVTITSKAAVKQFLAKNKITVYYFGADW